MSTPTHPSRTCADCGEPFAEGERVETLNGAPPLVRWHRNLCSSSRSRAYTRAYRREDGLIVSIGTGQPPPSAEPYIVLWWDGKKTRTD